MLGKPLVSLCLHVPAFGGACKLGGGTIGRGGITRQDGGKVVIHCWIAWMNRLGRPLALPMLSGSLRPLEGSPFPWLGPSLVAPVDVVKQAAFCRREDVLPAGLLAIRLNSGNEFVVLPRVDRLATGRVCVVERSRVNLEGIIQLLNTADVILREPPIPVGVSLYKIVASWLSHLLGRRPE